MGLVTEYTGLRDERHCRRGRRIVDKCHMQVMIIITMVLGSNNVLLWKKGFLALRGAELLGSTAEGVGAGGIYFEAQKVSQPFEPFLLDGEGKCRHSPPKRPRIYPK